MTSETTTQSTNGQSTEITIEDTPVNATKFSRKPGGNWPCVASKKASNWVCKSPVKTKIAEVMSPRAAPVATTRKPASTLRPSATSLKVCTGDQMTEITPKSYLRVE